MKYTLYSGAGNLFALTEQAVTSQQAIDLCAACSVDGVIFAENVFRMRIFNRDGSEAEMCGNGLRCFIKFLIDHDIHREQYQIETLAGRHTAWVEGSRICVQLPPPQEPRWNLAVEEYTVHHIDTGVPHAVLFVDSIDSVDVAKVGSMIRHHPQFPEGVNVNFVDPASLCMRTYERGVERETLACGTGATASALVLSKIFKLPSPLTMRVQSGDTLKISFNADWSRPIMEGPAERIGEGTFL